MEDMLSVMRHDFKVVKIVSKDARGDSDHLHSLSRLVYAHEAMYPGINKWFDGKVIEGLKSEERVAFVGYLNERPIVSAIVKRREAAKICHIKVADAIQGMHYGELFMILMALEVRGFAKEMHVTLPESLWERKAKFFQSFGFESAVRCLKQYRELDEEMLISTPYSSIWQSALSKLPKLFNTFLSLDGFSLGDGLLMSIQPKWAKKILAGEKKVELRRKFSRRWTGATVKIYSSTPEQCLVGEAKISRVVSDDPIRIWKDYGHETGCTKREFDDYVGTAKEVSAIVFSEVRPYTEIIPLSQLSYLVNAELRPPQSYCRLENSEHWAEAVSVAALLQNSFRYSRPMVVQL
jgi:predicted transcriptional regulator